MAANLHIHCNEESLGPRSFIRRGIVGAANLHITRSRRAANLHVTSIGRYRGLTYNEESSGPRTYIYRGLVGTPNLHITRILRGLEPTYNEELSWHRKYI